MNYVDADGRPYVLFPASLQGNRGQGLVLRAGVLLLVGVDVTLGAVHNL
jgi:hypothetical protein